MKSARFLAWLLVVAACGVLAGAIAVHMLAQKGVSLQGGTWLPGPRGSPVAGLVGLDGRPFDFRLARQPALLFLGYSNCPDVCPTTLATLHAALHDAPLPGLRVLFASLDPERDTPQALRHYLAAFGPEFTGLYVAPAELGPLQRQLSALVQRLALPGGGYALEHSATVYLLDAEGRLAAVFTPPLVARTLAADLKSIAAAGAL